MSILTKIFSGGAADLVKSVGGVIDNLHTSKEEKLTAELKIKQLISDYEVEMEKNIIGFASFIVMVLFAIADLLTSLLADKDLLINEVVYNSFVWVTLGCFGISSFEKIKTK